MEQTPSQTPSQPPVKIVTGHKSNRALQVIPWVGTVLLLGLIALLIYLYASKQVVFAGNNNSAVNITKRVCGSSVIATYNSAYTASSAEAVTAGLKKAADESRTLEGNQTDPNCVFMQFTYDLRMKNVGATQNELTTLKGLAKQNQYATSELVSVLSIDSMQAVVNVLTGQTKVDTSQGANG